MGAAFLTERYESMRVLFGSPWIYRLLLGATMGGGVAGARETNRVAQGIPKYFSAPGGWHR